MNDEFTSVQTIFDHAPIGMVLTTHSGQVVNMNNCLIKMLGYSSLDDVKTRVKNIAEDFYAIPELRERIVASAKKNETNTPLFLRIKKKDGTLINVRVNLQSYINEETRDEYLIGTVEDLTHQQDLENQITNIRQQFQQFYNSSPSAVFIHQDHIFIDFNKKAKELFGLDDPLKTYSFTDISPEYQPDGQRSADKGMALIQKALNGTPQKFEWEFTGVNGDRITGEIALSRIEGGFYGNLFAVLQDLTEIKNTERKLQEREAILRSIIDSVPFELLVTDLNSNVLMQNKLTREIWGDFLGKNVLNAPLDKEAQETWNKNIEHISKNQILDYEIEIQLKGETKHQHRISAPYIFEGKICGGVHLAIDVTERVSIQKQANQTASFLNSILDTIPLEVWVIDGDDYVQHQSKFSQDNWGDLRGKQVSEFKAPVKFSVDPQSLIHEVRNGKIVDVELEVEFHGKKIYTRRLMAPVKDINGKTGYTSISFDITKLKNTISELKKHKESLEILVQERTQEIEKLNDDLQASNEELSAQLDDIIQKHVKIEEQNAEIDQKNSLLKKSNKERKKAIKELRNLNSNMEKIIAEQTQDIKSAMQRLQESESNLDTLLYRSSHDLKGPLTTLSGLAMLAKFEKEEDQRDVLCDLVESTSSIMIRNLNKLQEVHLILNKDIVSQVVDIDGIKVDLLAFLDKLDIYSEVKKIFEINNPLKFQVKTDAELLKIILENISENSIFFRGVEKPFVKVTLNVDLEKLHIYIEDNGLGLDDENSDLIFEMFYRGKEHSKGAGLGLYTAKMAINKLNGSISVSSQASSTCFIVKVPLMK